VIAGIADASVMEIRVGREKTIAAGHSKKIFFFG
jgi:hypothetical protein